MWKCSKFALLEKPKSKEIAAEFSTRYHNSDALPNLYGENANEVDAERSTVPQRVPMEGRKMSRRYSHKSLSSHEVLFPYGIDAMFTSSPQMSSSQNTIGVKGPDSDFYPSPETVYSVNDAVNTGLKFPQMACESP
ncbi:hypothetical protein COOONC_00501 [Cooperia oncophora]